MFLTQSFHKYRKILKCYIFSRQTDFQYTFVYIFFVAGMCTLMTNIFFLKLCRLMTNIFFWNFAYLWQIFSMFAILTAKSIDIAIFNSIALQTLRNHISCHTNSTYFRHWQTNTHPRSIYIYIYIYIYKYTIYVNIMIHNS